LLAIPFSGFLTTS